MLHVRREKIEEYRECHAAIWPAMVEALQDAGWKNYSLFLQTDGLLVGYFETEDLVSSQEKMQAASVNAQWQHEMAHCFENLGETMPDQNIIPLTEVFHLT
ncbi:MAG: L-rhamnose mutarotase [Edaphobacter sp.]|uniref:L-rhamnose mutarotase n=1 Tax=Edaphobacter sp. TaxID=1934404 RepID=UPI0020B121C8|nr:MULTISPECIES: L-rhamnose mutarotase [Acidobacteriaceae]MDW5267071.1 L-rhamnose mutarotase [Edaphobacter sp.]